MDLALPWQSWCRARSRCWRRQSSPRCLRRAVQAPAARCWPCGRIGEERARCDAANHWHCWLRSPAQPPAPRLPRRGIPGTPHRHPLVDPDYRMTFPRDFGAHPAFRTEWWYVTGWLGEDRGFQVTFFRVRTGHPQDNPSRFAPTQLLFAHAALMLPKNRHALHGQRAARIGSPGAQVFGAGCRRRHRRLDAGARERRPLPHRHPRHRLRLRPDRLRRPATRATRAIGPGCRSCRDSRARDRGPSRRATTTAARSCR